MGDEVGEPVGCRDNVVAVELGVTPHDSLRDFRDNPTLIRDEREVIGVRE
jgi:hypothetical protein